MPKIEVGGKEIEVDENGYLVNPDDWTKEVSIKYAKEEGIKALTEDHWRLIETIRSEYKKYGIPPVPDRACKLVGIDRKCVSDLLSISVRRSFKIAGLPQVVTGDVG